MNVADLLLCFEMCNPPLIQGQVIEVCTSLLSSNLYLTSDMVNMLTTTKHVWDLQCYKYGADVAY